MNSSGRSCCRLQCFGTVGWTWMVLVVLAHVPTARMSLSLLLITLHALPSWHSFRGDSPSLTGRGCPLLLQQLKEQNYVRACIWRTRQRHAMQVQFLVHWQRRPASPGTVTGNPIMHARSTFRPDSSDKFAVLLYDGYADGNGNGRAQSQASEAL